jgi:RHS repeat-associated protein
MTLTATHAPSAAYILQPRYTGKERDAESGLDYFGARYYASTMGRFSSPDPTGLYFADPTDPQSLNLYAYVGNHTMTYVDPSGLNWFNQAPCNGQHYDVASVGTAIKSFFRNLFANCGGGGGGTTNDDQIGGINYGPSGHTKHSNQDIDRIVQSTGQSFSSTCQKDFATVGGALGIGFSLKDFTGNLLSGPFDQQPDTNNGATAAETDSGGPVGPAANGTIHLYAGFYGESENRQGFTLFHEETHRYFNLRDYQYPGQSNKNFDSMFGPFGYLRHNAPNGNTGTSSQFTDWLQGGCKKR